jgi:fructokinase
LSLKPRIVALGELLWDLLPEGPSLGGAPANVAYHATRAGGRGALISRVGQDDLGERAVRELEARGVDVTWVGRDAQHPTGTVEVRFAGGQPTYTIGADAAWDHIELPSVLDSSVDAFALGTLAARTPGAAARTLDFLRQVHAAPPPRPLLALDLNLRPPHINPEFIQEVLPLVDVLKLNEEEQAWLVDIGRPWTTRAAIVALTRGARGAALSVRGVTFSVPGIAVQGGDPIGAGDAFLASVLVELGRGVPPELCLERANRYAAGVASATGAMPP